MKTLEEFTRESPYALVGGQDCEKRLDVDLAKRLLSSDKVAFPSVLIYEGINQEDLQVGDT